MFKNSDVICLYILKNKVASLVGTVAGPENKFQNL